MKKTRIKRKHLELMLDEVITDNVELCEIIKEQDEEYDKLLNNYNLLFGEYKEIENSLIHILNKLKD